MSAVKPGESVTFTRNPDYWGRDLPINRGLWNFDDHPASTTTATATPISRPSRKASTTCASRPIPAAGRPPTTFPALRDGRVVKEAFPYGLPKGMDGLVFNTRRPIFADVRVREAILHLFDFEWINHNYFFDLYERTASYFDGCESVRAWRRRPTRASANCSAPFPGAVRADIMDGQWTPPETDGSGRDRDDLAPRVRRCSRKPATRSKAPQLVASRDRPPLRVRDSDHHARPGARWRSPSRATSSAPASTRRCAASTPRSSSAAASASIST